MDARPAAMRGLRLLALLAVFTGLPAGAVTGRSEEPFDYFRNSWTVLGLKDYPDGTRVSPEHELLLAGGTRLRVLLGRAATPIPRHVVKTLRNGWLPVVEWRWKGRVVDAFAAPLPGGDARARLRGPVDGNNYLNIVRVRPGGDARLQFVGPEGPLALTWERLPSGARRAVREGKTWAVASPGGVFRVPFAPLEDDRTLAAGVARDPDGSRALASVAAFWEGLLARGATLEVPEKKVLDTYRASLVYQFIGRDGGRVHAGEGFYDTQFLRDGAYQLWSLALAGYLPEARESLTHLLRFQTPDGQFVSQEGQLDAHGYGLWMVTEHYHLTRDRAWLRAAYPAVRQGVAWLQRSRRTNTPDGPFAGLLPAAPADGENLWTTPCHIVGYDFWSLRGLLCAVEAARALRETVDASEWAREAADYRADIDRALARTGRPFFPPSFEGKGTHWGDLECLFPTPLFAPHDPRVTATLEEVRRRFGGGYVEGTIRWSPDSTAAIHPYMTQFVTHAEIIRGEQRKAVADFYAFLLHTTATHGFPEGVYYRSRTAWGDTVPHLWAAALYTLTLRHMLIREQGEELHLSSAVPAAWLGPGRTVRLANAPTRFGPVSITWKGERDAVLVQIAPPRRNPPTRIVIHLPEGFRVVGAAVDAGKPAVRAGAVEVSAGARRVRVRVERKSAPALSYARVVRDFLRHPAPWERPIPSLVRLPLASPLNPEACVLLDLAPAATTDPFRAPFCVEGTATFDGLMPGTVRAGGVPFRIPDPAANGGKGFAVLRGAEACAELPETVRLPIRRRAKRAYFLGGVTGWNPGDPGAGPWGAVAEYVIRYADGTEQVVPLITGRTADDWLQPPGATDTFCGLRGRGWHLNVLGVTLRDREVEEIVFRDLGTKAAPVLAAVTLEN